MATMYAYLNVPLHLRADWIVTLGYLKITYLGLIIIIYSG